MLGSIVDCSYTVSKAMLGETTPDNDSSVLASDKSFEAAAETAEDSVRFLVK